MEEKGLLVEEAAGGSAAETSPSRVVSAALSAAVVSPRFAEGEGWPWLSRVGPLRDGAFTSFHVDNLFRPCPSLTTVYRRLQFRALRRAIDDRGVTFLFSPDVAVGMTAGPRRRGAGRRIYVGFTQDEHWSTRRLVTIRRALRRCDAVTVFSEAERAAYIQRFDLDPERIRVIPIHDEPEPISPAPPAGMRAGPFVLSLGVMNRAFAPVARICRAYHLPLVVLTRRGTPGNDLLELEGLGATVVLDAPLPEALAYMERAAVLALPFRDESLPAGFTTVMHAMRLGTPVVASECVGIREHVEHGQTGFVTPHGEPAEMRKAIRYLWRDARPRRAMGKAAQRRWAARHAALVAADAFHDLALEVMDSPRAW